MLRFHGSTGATLGVAVSHPDLRSPMDLGFTSGTAVDTVWFDDALPAGAVASTSQGGPWTWVDNNPVPLGAKAHRAFSAVDSSGGVLEHSFNFAFETMTVGAGDSLFVHVFLHSDGYADRGVMISWCDGSWEHRAYWGANGINAGTPGTAGRRYMGALPRGGGWFRLEVPASLLGLEGRTVQGMSFATYNVPATFDFVGKTSHAASFVDTTPPTVRIEAPVAGATVSGDSGITAEALDNVRVRDVRFVANGTIPLGATSGSGNYSTPFWSISWDTRTLADGTYAITAIATDTVGNQTTSAAISVTVANSSPPSTPRYWVDDDMPPGAWGGGSGGDAWTWVTATPAPFSGTRAHQSNVASGLHEHYFNQAATPFVPGDNDLLIAHVYLDPGNPPTEVMLSWFDGTSWEHRAYWGADQIGYGTNNTASRWRVSSLPNAGTWVRLEVPASHVGLAGRSIYGMAFAAYGGRVTWDAVGAMGASRDVAAPSVTITSPANGATVSGNVTVSTSTTDNTAVASVALSVDGMYNQSVLSSPYQFMWDSTQVANGTHTLRVSARDPSNNTGEATISVTVNNSSSTIDLPPTLDFASPAPGSIVYGTITITANATDDRGVAYVEFRGLNGAEVTRVSAPPYAITWDTRTALYSGVTVYAVAVDTSGRRTEKTLSLIVDHKASGDTQPPAVTIDSPAAGATVSGIVTIATTASDSYGIAETNFFGNTNTLGRRTSAPWALTWNTQQMTDGPVRLRVQTRDYAGNTTEREVNVTIANGAPDFSAPTVVITSPASDSTVSGNVTVIATASDNETVASVQFSLDGAPLQAADTTAPYSLTWNSATVADGAHVLSALATDAAGNVSPRATVTVNVNNSAPPTSDIVWFDDAIPAGAASGGSGGDGWNWITSSPTPRTGARAHQSNISSGLHEHYIDWATGSPFAVSASDTLFAWVYLDPANMPQEIMLSLRDSDGWEHRAYWGANLISYGTHGTPSRRAMGALPGGGTWVKLTVPASSVGLGSSPLIGISFSAYGGRVTWDAVGKAGSGPTTPPSDTTPPTVALTSPTNNATVTGSSLTLTASASDNVGVHSVSFYRGDTLISTDATAPYATTWNTTTVLDGMYVLTARARDAAGNEVTSASVSVRVQNNPPPNSSPTVTLTSPTEGAAISGNITLSATASDPTGIASVSFLVNSTVVARLTSPPYTYTWNSRTVANGSHSITVDARNPAGNGATRTAIISVNNSGSTGAVIWMDGNVPAGAWTSASGGDAWTWVTANPAPFAGTRVHQSAIAAGVHDHSFQGATTPFAIYTGDTIFAYVYLDPANVPAEIMLSFNDGTWEHRAYWGANVITYGQDGTNSRRYLGALPAAGQWVKLEVPARLVGLDGRSINGVSFTLVGGRATWDIVGKVSP